MKKLLVVLLSLLLLAGCGKGYSQLSDGSDVLFTTPDGDYTRNDLYKSLKLSSSDAIEADLITKIGELEEIDTTDIESEIESYIELYTSMGYEYYLIYSYGSLDAFRKENIASGILSELAEKYVEEKFDDFVSEDIPVKMQLAYFDDEETANKVIEEINNGATFDTAVLNNGYDQDASEQIYLDTDATLSYYVKKYLNETDALGLSTVITSIASSSDSEGNITNEYTYYLVNVIDKDVENYKDEYIDLKLESVEDADVKSYFFEKHDIKFYDQDIYEMMYANYEVLK